MEKKYIIVSPILLIFGGQLATAEKLLLVKFETNQTIP